MAVVRGTLTQRIVELKVCRNSYGAIDYVNITSTAHRILLALNMPHQFTFVDRLSGTKRK